MYGGRTSLGPDNELWAFKFAYLKWEKTQTFNTPPPSTLFGYASFVEALDEFFIIQGGITTKEQVNLMFR